MVGNTDRKPLYQKFSSRNFLNKAEADTWAKKQKADYSAAGISIKHDIIRQPGGWQVILYQKL